MCTHTAYTIFECKLWFAPEVKLRERKYILRMSPSSSMMSNTSKCKLWFAPEVKLRERNYEQV